MVKHPTPSALRRVAARYGVLVCLVMGGLAVIPAVASANDTRGIPGFNCSVTAHTPYGSGQSINFLGGVSCGGSQYNYSKQVDTQAWQLVTGGWQEIHDTGWSAWSSNNPLQFGWGFWPCVSGRWYTTVATGQVSHNGVVSGNTANASGSAYRCP